MFPEWTCQDCEKVMFHKDVAIEHAHQTYEKAIWEAAEKERREKKIIDWVESSWEKNR